MNFAFRLKSFQPSGNILHEITIERKAFSLLECGKHLWYGIKTFVLKKSHNHRKH